MFEPLDGPALQDKIAVTTGTAVEVKVGAVALTERKVITLQPTDGDIKVYFGDGVTVPLAATVLAKGMDHFKKNKETYEASEKQSVYIVAASGTVNVVIVERA